MIVYDWNAHEVRDVRPQCAVSANEVSVAALVFHGYLTGSRTWDQVSPDQTYVSPYQIARFKRGWDLDGWWEFSPAPDRSAVLWWTLEELSTATMDMLLDTTAARVLPRLVV